MTLPKHKQGYFWQKVYFSDHLADMIALSHAQKGVYQDLIWLDNLGTPLPSNPTKLAKVVRAKPKMVEEVLAQMGHKFVEDDGHLHHVDVSSSKATAEERTAQGKRAAEARYNKKSCDNNPNNQSKFAPTQGCGSNADSPLNKNENPESEGCGRTAIRVDQSRVAQSSGSGRKEDGSPSYSLGVQNGDFDPLCDDFLGEGDSKGAAH